MRRTWLIAILALGLAIPATAQEKPKEPPLVQAARKKLDTKITIDIKDESMLREALEEIKDQSGLSYTNDFGISLNQRIPGYKASDKPVKEVLDQILKKPMLGYVIVTKAGDRQEGWIKITGNAEQRGDEKPTKDTAKPEPKPKPKPEAKPEPKPDSDADAAEKAAASKLKQAKNFAELKQYDDAREYCEQIIKKYPKTKAAEEAKELLEKLKKK